MLPFRKNTLFLPKSSFQYPPRPHAIPPRVTMGEPATPQTAMPMDSYACVHQHIWGTYAKQVVGAQFNLSFYLHDILKTIYL